VPGGKEDLVDPVSLLTSVSVTLGIIDKIADQLERFKKKQPGPPVEEPHSVIAERKGDTIEFVKENRPKETIHAADLAKLDPQSQQLIAAIEGSMTRQFNLWTAVYPERNASADAVVNAKVEHQLDALSKGMCDDLGKILGYLEGLGKNLYDHYDSVQYICSQ
jgi:hypothetical protein